jgi:hypothetical protein
MRRPQPRARTLSGAAAMLRVPGRSALGVDSGSAVAAFGALAAAGCGAAPARPAADPRTPACAGGGLRAPDALGLASVRLRACTAARRAGGAALRAIWEISHMAAAAA